MGADDKLETIVLKRAAESDIGDLLVGYEYRGPFRTMLQLISNEWDCGAHKVAVVYKPEEGYLSVTGDGRGMLPPDDIQRFINFGGSEKKLDRYDKETGRKLSGFRGIATIGIQAMCKRMHLEAKKQGIYSIIDHKFGDTIPLAEEFPVERYRCDPAEHGTKIEMFGLKFIEGKEFNLRYLIRRIPWERPIYDDFKIFVSDGTTETELKARSVENAEHKIRIDVEDEVVGKLDGMIYITRSSVPEAGIHVYINQERLEITEDLYPLRNLKTGLRGILTIILYADDCEKALTADKTALIKGHPITSRLSEIVTQNISMARSIYERENPARRLREFKPGQHLGVLVRGLANVRGPEVCIDKPADKHIAQIIANSLDRSLLYRLGLDKNTKYDWVNMDPVQPGRYDPKSNTLSLNQRYYPLIVTPNTTPQQYKFNLFQTMLDIMAFHNAITLENFFARRGQLLFLHYGESTEAKETLIPLCVYDPANIASLTGRNIGAIRYMLQGGMFPHGEEGIQGKDYLIVEARTGGLISLYDFVFERNTQLQQEIDRFSQLIKIGGRSVWPYISNLGEDENPCYFVLGCCQDMVYNILKRLRVNQTQAGIRNEFSVESKMFCTIDQLAGKLKGIDKEGVNKVLNYAEDEKHKVEIRRGSEDNRKTYSFGDFITAVAHRQNYLNEQKLRFIEATHK